MESGSRLPVMKRRAVDYKNAAIEQWTADPCGEVEAEGEAGTRAYFTSLLQSRDDYAEWMHRSLGYAETANLDVLDVGCGQGIDVYRYAHAGARATGLDLTPRHVELAREHLAGRGLDANIVRGDAENMPFPAESFDRVSSNGVLHHTPKMDAALLEVLRVLRPGGEARIIVYNKVSAHYMINQFLFNGLIKGQLFEEKSMEGVLSRGVEHSRTGARPLVRVYSPRQLRKLMSAAGFVDCVTYVRHFHAQDTFVTGLLERRVSALRRPEVLDRIGRRWGWYVVAVGRKPRED